MISFPLFSIAGSGANPAFFSGVSQFYSYLFDGRSNRIMRCVFDVLSETEDHRYKIIEEKEQLKAYMKSMDMPLTFDELGVESTDENLKLLEDYLIDSPYVEKSEESYACLHEAMRQMRW